MTTEAASRELRPGEHLFWSGQGDPSVIFSPADAFLIPFSLLWGGFAIFWEVTAVRSGGGPLFAIFGAVFVVIGLYFIVGRFFVKAHSKRSTTYAVTDRRAFVTNGRTTRETALRGIDRTTSWSRDRSRVSVVWNSGVNRSNGFFGGGRSNWPGNSGMDGLNSFGGARPVAFYDVRDGQALIAAVDRAGAGH